VIAPDVVLGAGVVIYQPDLVNLYGCVVGAGSRIGAFVVHLERLHLAAHPTFLLVGQAGQWVLPEALEEGGKRRVLQVDGAYTLYLVELPAPRR
jgi:hypothetical protein